MHHTNRGRQSQPGPLKPALTIRQRTKPSFETPPRVPGTAKNIPLYYVGSLGFFGSGPKRGPKPLKALRRPARRHPEPVDQGLGAIERCKTRLHVPQPRKVLLAGLGAQGLLGIFELSM